MLNSHNSILLCNFKNDFEKHNNSLILMIWWAKNVSHKNCILYYSLRWSSKTAKVKIIEIRKLAAFVGAVIAWTREENDFLEYRKYFYLLIRLLFTWANTFYKIHQMEVLKILAFQKKSCHFNVYKIYLGLF